MSNVIRLFAGREKKEKPKTESDKLRELSNSIQRLQELTRKNAENMRRIEAERKKKNEAVKRSYRLK